MTKKIKNSLVNHPNVFESIKNSYKESASLPIQGSLDIDSELRAAISEDLKNAKGPSGVGISRYEVACRMSEMVGREITASMLYNWTSESHSENNFPLKYFPVFVIATGGQKRAVEVLVRKCGLVALPAPTALRAEIQQMDEEIERMREEREKRMVFLREINK